MGGGIGAPGIGDSRCEITVEIPMGQTLPAAGVAPEDGLFVPEFTVNVNLTHAVT